MNLKISSPWGVLFNGEVTKVTLPTYAWEITVLPWHQPLSSIVKSGIVSFATSESLEDGEYIISEWKVQIAVSKGLVLVDGKTIVITTSAATTSPEESAEVLEDMKKKMSDDLEKIKVDGNAEDLEKALENMEKIQADIRLVKMRNIG